MRTARCCLVLAAATAVAAGALLLLVPGLSGPGGGFERALVRGCAAVACGCALWGWACTAVVVAEALRAGDRAGAAGPARPGVPAALRRMVLAACGLTLTATAPALAGTGADPRQALPEVVAGLPFPSRATDLPEGSEAVVVVRRGDSLWAITERRLGPGSQDAAITRGWQSLYAHNREVVGDDPSLIHPGQRLALPDHLEEPS